MPEALGRSVYLSETSGIPEGSLNPSGVPVFISLHWAEEMDDTWNERVSALCASLNRRGCRILADISKRTLEALGVRTVSEVRNMLGLWAVRLDYGFELCEIKELLKEMPVVLNASMITEEEMKELEGQGELLAMHNFYPRPETGLDEVYLKESTDALHRHGFQVLAFIPGTGELRGPIHEGLPTLEAHRHVTRLAAYADLVLNYGIDQVYVGDPELNEADERRISRFIREGVLELECALNPGYEDLYDMVFTNRYDSPLGMLRAAESRELSMPSQRTVTKENTAERTRGSITMDNEGYLRYCGEVMICRKDYPRDERVNVIGRIREEDLPVLDLIGRGKRFVLKPVKE